MQFKKPLDGALFLFRKGYAVFPLKPNEKVPAFKNWQEWATTANLKKIEEFGTANPMYNWGVYCGGSNLLVIDLDNKHKGKNGFESLKNILKTENKKLEKTFTVLSPTGSQHLYYVGKAPSTTSSLGLGVDTKGEGGYVVAPGSRIDEKSYEIQYNENILPLPSWLEKLIKTKRKEIPILEDGKLILKGSQHDTLVSLAGSMRRRGMDFEAINAALQSVNDSQLEEPAPKENIEKIARSIARYEPQQAIVASDFLKIPKLLADTADNIEPNAIPKRDWIMKERYIGGFISVLIAPGGVGKSTFSILDAISIVTNTNLTGYEIVKQGGVWIYNTEDPKDELKRRIHATCMHYNISLKSLNKIYYTSGRDQPLILAKNNREGLAINKMAIETISEFIKKNSIVLLIADPFVRTHEVQENDNMQIDKVVWAFQRIAEKTNCAIGLVHHTRKGKTGGMDDARGASSLINASRIAHTVTPMTEEEADKFGIEEHRKAWYMRLDNAKANLTPPAEKADWFEKISVDLWNGDSVGTLQKTSLQDVREERKQEEFENDVKDLVMALSTQMEPGMVSPINEILPKIINNPRYPYLHRKRDMSERYLIPWCKNLLSEEIYCGNKKFIYETTPKKRPKHWIRCTKVEGFLL